MFLAWVFEGLKSEPYGLIPYSNLTGKGSTSVRHVKKLASYNWLCDDELNHPTIVVPGEPRQQQAFNGCKMPPDTEDLLFDPNIIGLPRASLDPVFEVLRQKFENDKRNGPIDFQKYDIVTDVINLQKLFAFCRGDDEGGLFRIDLERVGKLVLFNRIEGSGFIPVEPDFPSYDVNLKNKVSRSRCSVTDGPFQQISSYQFGAFNVIVRYQPEYAEYSPNDWLIEPKPAPEGVKAFTEAFPDSNLHYLKYGEKADCSLTLLSTYPEGRGFPNFLWPSMFFSGADRLLVGWFKGFGEFPKPASYSLADMNKLVKPLPYQIVTRVHDLLSKIINFMRNCDEDAKISLIWQGFSHLEIYERAPQTAPAISASVRSYLKSQCEPHEPEHRDSEDEHHEHNEELATETIDKVERARTHAEPEQTATGSQDGVEEGSTDMEVNEKVEEQSALMEGTEEAQDVNDDQPIDEEEGVEEEIDDVSFHDDDDIIDDLDDEKC